MKLFLMFAMSSLVTVGALAEEAQNYVIELDWNKPATLTDNVTQMCDDTYYDAVEIVIPGEPRKDFTVEIDADVTTGKVILGCSVEMKKGKDATVYTIDAGGGGCSVKVHKVRKDWKQKPQSAEYNLSDAC